MPLKSGRSAAMRSANIAELRRAGHPAKQAEAIAYRVSGDDGWEEGKHPRAPNDQFGSGGGGKHHAAGGGVSHPEGVAKKALAEGIYRKADLKSYISSHHPRLSTQERKEVEQHYDRLNAERVKGVNEKMEPTWVKMGQEAAKKYATVGEYQNALKEQGIKKSDRDHFASYYLKAKGDGPHASDALPLAFDRGSGREYDKDGRLHVTDSNISKANVCPYYGYEIPGYQALGLQPTAVYHLLRDPEELAKAAPTFNKIPLLDIHVAATAKSLPKKHIVGTTGTDATFEYPYLKNSLAVWDGEAIAGVETQEQHELSCSYHYRADMTPGIHEGVRYDGVMRDIVGNHVALVPMGRAGADVVVGDSTPPELHTMKRNVLALRVALGSYLRPALANDSTPIPLKDLVQPGMSPTAVANATLKHYGKTTITDRAALVDALQLAADAAEEMDAEDESEEEEDEEDESGEDARRARDRRAKDEREREAEDRRRAKDGKRGKDDLTPRGRTAAPKGEDRRAKDAREREEAEDARRREEEEAEDARRRGGHDKRVRDERDEAEDRTARDAALIERGRVTALASFKALREAEAEVAPLIGAVAAMDSAEAVYRLALEQTGIDLRGVPPTALRAMVQLAVSQRTPAAVTPSGIAMDAAAVDGFAEMFPTAAKPGRF